MKEIKCGIQVNICLNSLNITIPHWFFTKCCLENQINLGFLYDKLSYVVL